MAECLKRCPAAGKKRVPRLSQYQGAGYAFDDVRRGIAFELPSKDEQHDARPSTSSSCIDRACP